MPTSSRFLGGETTTKYCPFCERAYEGDQRNVAKLLKLHMKKAHNAEPAGAAEMGFSFSTHNGDMKKANAEAEAGMRKLREWRA